MKYSQLTDTVVMISPDQFGFNPQTAVTNVFQHHLSLSEKEVRDKAMKEFRNMVEVLKMEKVRVLVLGSRVGVVTPDAVFPNNWFSHHQDGRLVLYPMLAENRRRERQFFNLKNLLSDVKINHIKEVDFSSDEKKGLILEGTGSLVLDRENQMAFAMESPRTTKREFDRWCLNMGFEGIFFHAQDSANIPVYHTNIIMSIGREFVVICLESIKSQTEKLLIIKKLTAAGKKIIPISLKQMYKFCANILQLVSTNGSSIIVMSRTVFEALTSGQKTSLEKYGKLVVVDIPTIEAVGGGSARCMLAEIFK
ncbi:amidinotransferase [Candidatus Roizmanbacteria bacterium]|nr:amidinotransferase [Candidatus Roizmanbacteria bacterium]